MHRRFFAHKQILRGLVVMCRPTQFSMAARLIPALCATAAFAVPAAFAQDSIARCNLSLSSAGSAESQAVAVEVAEQTSVFVCDPNGPLSGGSVTATAQAIAEASATAVASAIASVTVQCFAEGNANFQVNGRGLAEAEAFSLAQAYASALGDAEDCNRCQTSASFVASQFELIILEATVDLQFRLAEAATPGTPVTVAFNNFVADFQTATSSALASVFVQARVSAEEEGCSVVVEGDIVVDANLNDTNPPLTVDCEINTTAISTTFAQDVYVDAIASVDVFACQNGSMLQANQTASEVAIALAQAIAILSSECEVSGGGFACVWANSSITALAEACASVFAQGYASAVMTCKPECAINATAVESELVSIFANATASAFLDQCVGPDELFNITIIQEQISSTFATAVASVIIDARVNNGTCIADVNATATVTPVNMTTTTTTTVTNSSMPVSRPPTPPAKPPPPPPVKPPPPPPVVQPPPPPPVVKPPPPPPVVKPPPPPPVVKPPPPPPVVKPPPPPPVVKPPPPPPVVKPPPKKDGVVITTNTTESSSKTPNSSTRTKTSTTVVVDGHVPPGTFVATSTAHADGAVTSGCTGACAGDYTMCFGSGMKGVASCCSGHFECVAKDSTYGQCLPMGHKAGKVVSCH
eukprot:jgi/Ulvmu1/6354/UM029_0062.1